MPVVNITLIKGYSADARRRAVAIRREARLCGDPFGLATILDELQDSQVEETVRHMAGLFNLAYLVEREWSPEAVVGTVVRRLGEALRYYCNWGFLFQRLNSTICALLHDSC